MTVGLTKDELVEEYDRYSDTSIWDRTEIFIDGDTRYFIVWLRSTKGMKEMISIMRKLCSNLRCFFHAASEIQSLGEGKMGKLEAWLEARICIGISTEGGRGCFTICLDPGGMQGETVSTRIISPEGDEVGACVFGI